MAQGTISAANLTSGTVQSKDGTSIAYSKSGSGPPLIVVDGALCYRKFGPSGPLAKLLSSHFSVYTYDRRGRGESGDSAPYDPAREIEDLESLIDMAGGKAALFGQSSGGVVVLEAANKLGTKVSKFAMYEDPFFVDSSRPPMPANFISQMNEHLAAGRAGEPVKMFMKLVGTPAPFVLVMPLMPMWKQLLEVSPTLPHDFAFMQEFLQCKPLPAGRWPGATQPALALVGSKSPVWMQRSIDQVTANLSHAKKVVLTGQTHMVKAEALAPELVSFFA